MLGEQSLSFKLDSWWASKIAAQERVDTHFSYTCLAVLNFLYGGCESQRRRVTGVYLWRENTPWETDLEERRSLLLLVPRSLLLRRTLLWRQEIENRVLLRIKKQKLWFFEDLGAEYLEELMRLCSWSSLLPQLHEIWVNSVFFI